MIFRKKIKFINQISFEQYAANTYNPARGWYSLFPFTLPDEPDLKELEYCLNPMECLVLVRICIQQYQKIPLDDKALSVLTNILEFFKKHKKEIILRVVYDQEGNGLIHEPSTIALIKTHIRQIGEVITPLSSSILTTQGIFVGSWGEMHTSRYLSSTDIAELVLCQYESTRGSIPMALRTPVQLRALKKELEILTSPEVSSAILKLTGLYNDGMTASETDYGTYGNNAPDEDTQKWNRSAELAFQQQLCQTVYNGGEVVNPNSYNDGSNAIQTFKMMHVSYLNSQYDCAVLNKWKAESITTPEGTQNVYDYIGTHLGYCILLTDAKPAKHGSRILLISVTNTGFASLYQKVRLKVTAVCADSRETFLYSEPDTIPAETTCRFSCTLDNLSAGTYHLSCCLERISDQREISFYNAGNLGTLTIP